MKKALIVLKKNIILFLAVIIGVTAAGVAAAFIRKPYYTATEPVDYTASIGDSFTSNNSAMTAYMSTVVDFCDSGVVTDRADYYYAKYLESGSGDLNAFIAGVKENDDYDQKLAENKTSGQKKYFTADMISVNYNENDTEEIYAFDISLKDVSPAAARVKLRILVLAFDMEVTDYFVGLKTSIRELVDSENDIPVKVDMSKTKIVALSFVLGCVLAAAAVYLVYVLDKTIADKKELEEITGVKLLAEIYDQEAAI